MQDVRCRRDRIGEEGEGFTIAMSAIDQGRFTVASGAMGLAQACLDASSPLRTRAPDVWRGDRPASAGEGDAREDGSRHRAGRCCLAGRLAQEPGQAQHARDEPGEVVLHRARGAAALDAIQVHGAYGYSNEYPVERYLRNGKAAVIYEGTASCTP